MNDDPAFKRQNDILLVTLNQKFIDFLQRYERDQETTEKWREAMSGRVETMETFILKLRPWHSVMMLVAISALLGTIGVAIKSGWDHLVR